LIKDTNNRIKNQINPYLPKSFNEHKRTEILEDSRTRGFGNVAKILELPLIRYTFGVP
jgi:hypothetical protein